MSSRRSKKELVKKEVAPPVSIRVGYQDYAVSYEAINMDNREHFGQMNSAKATITVTNVGNKLENTNTLIHEILHAVFHTQGIKVDHQTEEMIVNAVANGLTGVLRDNPVLIEYILDQLGMLDGV